MRKLSIIFAFLLSYMGGVNSAWAQDPVASTNFDELGDNVLPEGWGMYNASGASSLGTYYNVGSDYKHGNSGKSLYANYSSTNTYYIVTPTLDEGTISFYYANTSNAAGSIYIYEAEESGSTFKTKGNALFSKTWSKVSTQRSPEWTQGTFTLDREMRIAIQIVKGALDDFEATLYVETEYKAPVTVTVDEITAHSATINWTQASTTATLTGWNLEYKKNSDATWTGINGISANATSQVLTELQAGTKYDVRVQAVYDNELSKWKAATFTTEREAIPAAGFTDDFESDNGWFFVNNTSSANSWLRGTATSNGGTYSMYISNDGTSNTYSMSEAMATYATKLFSFEAGNYTIQYDWKAIGESNYDFLRVALVPASDELTATYSSIGTTSLPSGWTELDGGSKLNLKTSWHNVSKDIYITEAGTYQIVFAWRNDGSGGENPPAAIDNFSITKHALSAPTDLTASNVTATSATLSWTANSGETSWDIAYGETGFNPDAAGTVVAVSENPYTLTVAPETSYDVYVRAKNDQGESGWSEKVSFTTPELYPKPTTASSTNTTAKSATIGWTENGTATAWEVVFDTNASFDKDTATPILADSNPFTLTGLEPATTYYAYVRSYIDGTNHSGWSEVFSFTTGYGVPFTEEFSSSSIPTGWNRYSGLMSGVIAGTTSLTLYTSNYGGWTIDSSWARVNIYGTSLSNWLVSPNIEIDGNCTLSFDVAYQAYSGGGAPQTTGTDDKFVVLVKDGDTWNQLALWDNDDATESKVLNDIEYQTGGENVILDLSAFNGKSIQIAFYAESTVSNADNNLWLDNINISVDTPVIATTDNYGYTTFSCDQALDLTTANMPEGLEAYKAAVNGTKVNLTKLDQTVPANTGILLKGNANTEYQIATATTSTTVEGNDFLATDGTSVVTSDETNFIFVMKKNQETLTFSKYVGTAALPVNKAYLVVPAANFDGGNARLSFTFEEGEATGIATAEGASRMNDGAVYNLQGQKVEKAQKGLYIVNGKKVVIK